MFINEHHNNLTKIRDLIYISSYNKNDIVLSKKCISKFNGSYIRVKCPYCNYEYDTEPYKNRKCPNCCHEYENSFAYYIQQELKEPLNKYWDWEKNTLNPYHVSKGSNKKIWIKCTEKDYHGSYEISIKHFCLGNRCPYCTRKSGKVHLKDSFAQYHIDNTDPNFLEKYWSDKNTLNPWEISPRSHKKIWIKCPEKDYHEDYITECANFTFGCRCPYCSHKSKKIHLYDSFGYLYPNLAKYWSDKNKKSPFEIYPNSNSKYWFKCENCNKQFKRELCSLIRTNNGCKCVSCTTSRGEYIINEFLLDNDVKFETQKTFEGLIGLGGGNLSYDFYLPDYNLLIEFQGQQHEHYIKGFHKNKEDFQKQVEHDRRKFNYAINNKIDILYLYYYEVNELESRLKYELNLGGVK